MKPKGFQSMLLFSQLRRKEEECGVISAQRPVASNFAMPRDSFFFFGLRHTECGPGRTRHARREMAEGKKKVREISTAGELGQDQQAQEMTESVERMEGVD